jgi:hypothetical protein
MDGLIDKMRQSKLERTQKLALLRERFENLADLELCEPCAVAVLDAVAEHSGGAPVR